MQSGNQIQYGFRVHSTVLCERAADYLNGKIKVCTVIGFPNGYNTTKVKIAETEDALQNGADEIDMVINLGDVKIVNFIR